MLKLFLCVRFCSFCKVILTSFIVCVCEEFCLNFFIGSCANCTLWPAALSLGWSFSKSSASVLPLSLTLCFSPRFLKWKALLSLVTPMASYTVVIVPLRNRVTSLDAVHFFLWVSLLSYLCFVMQLGVF